MLKAAGFDLVIVETPGHRPGRRRHRAVRRPLAVRDDAGVRRRVAAREDRHARLRRRRRDQQVRAPRRRGRPPRRGPPAGAQPRGVRRVLGGHAGLRHQRRHLQRRRRHRALPAPARPARRRRARRRRGHGCRRTDRKTSTEHAAVIPPQRVRYLAEIAETVRGYHADTDEAGRRGPAPASTCAPRGASSSGDAGGRRRWQQAEQALPAEVRRAARRVAAGRSRPTPATRWSCTVRDKELHTQLTRETLSGTKVRRVALPRFTEDAELLRFLRRENLPGQLPVHRRGVPVQARGRGPGRMFAGEGDAFRTNRRFKLLSAALRRQAAVHRVRLGHALRPRPGHPPGRLRQGRHVRRLDRDARRHEGALRRLRPDLADHLGVDDDQRPGADDPGLLPEHRDRPAGRPVPRGARAASPTPPSARSSPRSRWRTSAARCRPTSSRRTRARTPASSPPSSACG